MQARKEDKGLDSAAAGSSGSSNDNDSCSDSTITTSSTYSHYSYLCAPPNGSWVDLKNGIELERVVTRCTNEGSNRSSRITVTTITLRATHGGVGPSTINAFIDHCVDLYNAELRSKIDTSRYFYTPVLSASSEDKARSGMLYKRYKLSDARSFASFFHPEKATILSLVDQFVNKTGKFSIPGYPLKLGFLLHGPPGTGKTSFIKALAQYTGRHVVNIPLSKIRTNQELMNIMFDQSICITGTEDNTATSLPFSRVIFVMEDVDAASGVVHRRAPAECGGASATAQQHQAMEAMAMAAAMAAAASAGKGSDGRSRSGDEDRESNDGPRTPGRTPEPGGGTWGTASSVGAGGGGGGGGSEIEMGPVHWKDLLKDSASDNDKLNLASLLNVLDGVIDTPDRIVVLTTNHPEKLDPALIRPGRINRKVYLGNIKLSQAQAMMRHYFNAGSLLDAHTEQRLADVFVDDVMSPAQLESMCAEYESVEELIDQLQSKLQRLAPPPLVAFGSNCLVAGKAG